MISIQDAYVKGLDDAENAVIDILLQVLNYEKSPSFNNPKLEALRGVIEARSNYYHELSHRNNNIGKTFRNKIKKENENLAFLKQ